MLRVLVLLMSLLLAWSASAEPVKVLRYAFRIAETGFDPAQISDLYSRTMAANIFDAPLKYAYLARPYQLKPNTAAAMPEVSADFKTWTIRIRPGIHFADDPAFKGRKRELTAADYIYALKRHYDPVTKSGNLYVLEGVGILGLSELRAEAQKTKKPFDYDRPVEGLQQVDRYTYRVRTAQANPRLIYWFADVMMGAVAREVVEAYGPDHIMEHPVGTGPWQLAEWRRSSRVAFTKNPNYREVFYDETPPADADPRLIAEAARLKGKRLPLVDRVEISIIEESQPRWLAFLNGEADMIDEVPSDFAIIAMPHNHLAPNLAKRGIRMDRYARADYLSTYFGMENPLVGGYEPAKVALRRAISLAYDNAQEIRLVRRGQAVPAQGVVAPGTMGYEPGFKSEMSDFDRARAGALLDLYGYVDRNGDGWREQPDGKPLVIELASQPDGQSRQLAELWQKNMDALKIRVTFKIAQWPENLKASRAGKLMMWGVSWSASIPDADDFLGLGYGPNKGQANHSRFDLPAYNALYLKQQGLPDGPERQALIEQMQRLMVAYMPLKGHVHRIFTDMLQPWVIGYKRNLFMRDFWQYVDIEGKPASS
ncbi:ABC transporter substrate-binding protein [Pelomonas sp. KK5]|uniref:ABC transporter substrate-binding protein n=1 Tax=Pelomonas sp. KK5 TaxID=1855730 RepID=UPI00097C04AF|nr:ABC transporter substrate-binding protein [Pelomonas sp. KK5]